MKTLVIAAALLIGACSAERNAQPLSAQETAKSDEASDAARASEPAPVTTGNTVDPAVAVDGEGLRLVDPVSGSTRPLSFGAPRAQVLQALAFRGPPGVGVSAECGDVAYANWPDGLSLLFNKGEFAGWALDRRSAGGLTTMSGVGPGTTRDALDEAYSVKVTESTLGTEFIAGGLSGLLDGEGAGAKVTNMWAGLTCIAR